MYKILNNIPDKSSCAYYRNLIPSIRMRDELAECGIHLDTSQTFNPNSDYDCYIFARIPDNPDIFPLIDMINHRGKTIIWDIDDELWNIPKSNRNSVYYTPNKLMWLNYYFTMSKRITTSTSNLARSITDTWKIDPNKIVVLENLIEESVYKKFVRGTNSRKQIKILWSGSDSHEGDLEPIDKLFERYQSRDDVLFVFFGYMPERYKALPPHKLMVINWSNRKFYEGTLSFIAPQIALMPLDDNQFNRCKSAIKYYEMAMSGAVCLAANIPPYSDVIEHRENGFLCNNVDDWSYLCDEVISKLFSGGLMAVDKSRESIINNYSWDSDNWRRRDWFRFFKSIPDL